MSLFSLSLSTPPAGPTAAGPSAVDEWHERAEADYGLCRAFADRFGARLARSAHSRRLGWERSGRCVYGILLPDPLPASGLSGGDWYVYYVWGETLFHRTLKEREQTRMLILPDAAEDWADLLRQAVRDGVYDVRYEVQPHYVNALGDIDAEPCGYEFRLSAYAPPPAAPSPFSVSGLGGTPEEAARDACRRWLKKALQERGDKSLSLNERPSDKTCP